ncbi:hypothetical protein DPMN_111565 [Dreissena polymorpha]|uniref:Uncharacterized protein n=2 Tax=Dreissena polymorpha TaxID=45954 RepID=A0A9D4KEQ2_DREPO|nr:hypothetical protein DPMN_111565 [Dreissena polymorpha]
MLKPFGCYNRVDDVTMADVTDTAATVKAVDKSVSVAPTNSTVLCDSVRKLKRGSQSSILSNETKNKQNAVDDEMPTSSVMIDPKKLTYDLNTADNANTSRSIIQDSISLTINVGNQPKAKAGVDPCTAVNEKNENGSSKLTINHSDCREIRNETLAPVETPEIEGQHSSLACNVVGEVNFSGDVSVLSNGKVFPVQPTSTNGNSE